MMTKQKSIIYLSVLASIIWCFSWLQLFQSDLIEYRDLATLTEGKAFYEFLISGSNKALIENPYLYGIALPFLLSVMLFFVDSENLIYASKLLLVLIQFISIVFYLLAVYKVVKSKKIVLIFLPISFLFFTNVENPFIIRPDALGLLFIFMIFYFADVKNLNRSIWFVVPLLIAAYLCKQYFLFYALPLFLYYSIRGSGTYFLMVFVILFSAINLIIIYFIPDYFFSTIFVQSLATGGSLKYSIRQLAYALTLLSPFLLVIQFKNRPSVESKYLTEFSSDKINVLHLLICVTGLVPLLVIGTNYGAFMSYHYQLFLPSLAFLIAVTCKHDILEFSLMKSLIIFIVSQTQILSPVSKPILRALEFPKSTLLTEIELDAAPVKFVSPLFHNQVKEYEYLDNGNLEYYYQVYSSEPDGQGVGEIFKTSQLRWRKYFDDLKVSISECGSTSYITKDYEFHKEILSGQNYRVDAEYIFQLGARSWFGQKIRIICDGDH